MRIGSVFRETVVVTAEVASSSFGYLAAGGRENELFLKRPFIHKRTPALVLGLLLCSSVSGIAGIFNIFTEDLSAFDVFIQNPTGLNIVNDVVPPVTVFNGGNALLMVDLDSGEKPELQGTTLNLGAGAALTGAFRIDFQSHHNTVSNKNDAIRFRMANTGDSVTSESRSAFSLSWEADGDFNAKYEGGGGAVNTITYDGSPLLGVADITMIGNASTVDTFSYTVFGDTRTLNPLHYYVYVDGNPIEPTAFFPNGLEFTLTKSAADFDPALGLGQFGLVGSSDSGTGPDYLYDNIVLRTGDDIGSTPPPPPPPPTNNTSCVSNVADLAIAIGAAQPGDTIFMCNGPWNNADILFNTDGLPGQPITLQASTPGQTLLTGQSKLRIAGDYLVVRGLHFTAGSASDGDHVIQFRNGTGDLANNSRLTECTITSFNPTDPNTDYKWVSVYGLNNRVDHCAFRGMNHIGVTLTVWLGTGAPANHTRIDNNYFSDRTQGSGNGFETIRIGTSTRSMQDSEALVESNLFYNCDGEIEIISSKSGGNIYRYNTFDDCEGQLTLRHGNGNVVEGNFFLGRNNTQSSGVRVIGEDHVVINNYFENLRGTGYRAALAMMSGIVNSPLNEYFQVQRALIAFNTFVGCRENFVLGIDDNGGTLPPLDCVIANNIVKGSDSPLIEYVSTPINMQYEGNIFHGASLGITQPPGITIVDPQLMTGSDGLQRPTSPTSPAIDAAAGSYPDILDDMDGDVRTFGTQDIGADEVAGTAPTRGPLTADLVGPRWMRPNTLVILDLLVDSTNANLTFDDTTGLAPLYYVQETADPVLAPSWSNAANYAPLDYTGGVFEVSVPLPPDSNVLWRVTTD